MLQAKRAALRRHIVVRGDWGHHDGWQSMLPHGLYTMRRWLCDSRPALTHRARRVGSGRCYWKGLLHPRIEGQWIAHRAVLVQALVVARVEHVVDACRRVHRHLRNMAVMQVSWP